jgi:arylesterase / paraoxonase
MPLFRLFRALSTYSLIAGALAVVFYVIETAWATGGVTPMDPHFLGDCRAVPGVVGAEDLAVHPRSGLAYLSAYDRGADARGEPVRGAIYAYRPGSTDAPRDLTSDLPASFRPHGISLWLNPDKKKGALDSLFVVNHAGNEHSVEIFDIAPDRLVPRRTVRDSSFKSPADVLAVSHDAFYVTNDSGTDPGEWSYWIETVLRFPFANVVYYDGQRSFEVADRIAKANGIAMSPDRSTLYVAALLGGVIHVYDRDEETGVAVERTRIKLRTSPDSVDVDANGNLWIGAHPRLLTLIGHLFSATDSSPQGPGGNLFINPAIRAPSQVLRVKPQTGGQYELNEIFADDGRKLMASSSAMLYRDRLLIGSLTDSHILDCRLKPHPTLDYTK